MKYCHSTNGEFFDSEGFDSRDEAIAACAKDCDLGVGETVFTGVIRPITADDVLPYTGSLLDSMSEQAFELVGDAADGWPDVHADYEKELEAEVREVCKKWIERNAMPHFFQVVEVERHAITENHLSIEQVTK